MQKKVCIISHTHLCRNPRVVKEAIAITQLGVKVTILTSIFSDKLLKEDLTLIKDAGIQYIFYNNLCSKNLKSFISRAANKVGRWLTAKGIENRWAIGYSPERCLHMSLTQNANLYICHQELPLYIGTLLQKKGKKVAFDIEDWYSEDLLQDARKFIPINLLRKIEQTALQSAELAYTTSEPMAKALSLRYQTPEIGVIYNSFLGKNLPYHIKEHNRIKLIWISQTVGPGRGLEKIIQSLNKVTHLNFELNLRGEVSQSYMKNLKDKLVNPRHQLVFLSLIHSYDIQADLLKYDMGLALESSSPLSRDLTITNKIFHYLSVGLPVLASDTAGQLSLAKDFNNGIYFFNTQNELTQILSNVNLETLRKERAEILTAYNRKYDWEIMNIKLQQLVKKCINGV